MTSPLVKPAAGYIVLSRLESSRSRPSIVTGNRSGAILVLLRAFLRRLVITQPQEARKAQATVGRPVAVADLDHELRLDPVGALRNLPRNRPRRERGTPPGQRLQPGEQLLLGHRADPAADPPAEHQPVLGRHAHQQATEL